MKISRRDFRFFFENAGYIVGQRALGAFNLAKAERYAREQEWEFHWEFEQYPDLSWMDEDELRKSHEVMCCLLRDSELNVLESLGNIVDADNAYCRVVEAELALEAMARELSDAPESLFAY